MPIKTSLIVT